MTTLHEPHRLSCLPLASGSQVFDARRASAIRPVFALLLNPLPKLMNDGGG